MKEFNVLGNCDPDIHYMVDTSDKIAQITEMVNARQYFTINRARQYGKTTTLDLLEIKLIELGYIVAYLSFEGLSDNYFSSPKAFCYMFMEQMQDYLEDDAWFDETVDDFKPLGKHVSKMCKNKKIVVFIDEVDKTSNNIVFLYFLGMLRDKYLKRKKLPTFHSVILAGVTNIKNIKYKMLKNGLIVLGDNEGSHNSPWNIAANFKVDMSFSSALIATMLTQYEDDHNTGMNITAISEEIYSYTSGYPFLVSRICQCIDEDLIEKDWTSDGVLAAVKLILKENNTLFDDMAKNLENNPELYNFVYDVLIVGKPRSYQIDNPIVSFGVMYGYFKDNNNQVAISNRIFEIRMSNYFISKDECREKQIIAVRSDIATETTFNMQLCLEKFARHYKELFNPKEDTAFLERHGRMVFLSYLKPLINGYGFYHIESSLTDYRRMDIVVDYGADQFIIELKLWRGDSKHEEAYRQLLGYMDSKNAITGYLLTFDFSKNQKLHEPQWVEIDGKRIFDVVV